MTILFHWHMDRIEGTCFCVATGDNYERNLPNNQLRDGQQRLGCLALERIQQRLNKDLYLHSILQFQALHPGFLRKVISLILSV